MLTLEHFATPPVVRTAILDFAEKIGGAGFTVDDLRTVLLDDFPQNPGAILGALCASGVLRRIGEEPSRLRSSKGRRIWRFVSTGST